MSSKLISALKLVLVSSLAGSTASAADLTGPWNVVVRPGEINTCGIDHKTGVSQWLLSQNGSTLSITVVGESTFPELGGKQEGQSVRLSGRSRDGNLVNMAYYHSELRFFLKESPSGLEGTRYYLGYRRDGERVLPCMTTYQVSAKKQ